MRNRAGLLGVAFTVMAVFSAAERRLGRQVAVVASIALAFREAVGELTMVSRI